MYRILIIAFILVISIILMLMLGKKNIPSVTPVDEAPKENIPYTIIAFGDSLTAGYGVEKDNSYPTVLEKRLKNLNPNISIVNMGVSGETTAGGLKRIDTVTAQKPSLILIGLGGNDMLRSVGPMVIKEHLRTILARCAEANIPVVLLGMRSYPIKGKTYTDEFNAIYSDLAQEFDIPFVPFFLAGVALNPDLNISDGIHPNKEGYEKIVDENILPVLLPLLKN